MSLYLALWGAILSTILAVIKIVSVFKDRPRLKLTASFIYTSINETDQIKGTRVDHEKSGPMEVLLRFKVVNYGTKPLQITGIIIESEGMNYNQVRPVNFPVVLDGLSSVEADIQKEWIDKEEVSLLGVVDALGKRHSITKANLQYLLDANQKLPSNKKKFMHKETGEIVTAFQAKDAGILIKKNDAY
jgi:hypothetical protein